MTIMTEGRNSLYLTTTATLFDDGTDQAAWASKYVVKNRHIKWVLGNYVEADNANSNGQYWEYENLRLSQPTINHSPMNVDHRQRNIVGTWVANEMVYPTDQDSIVNPYIETLGAFWKYYFPEVLEKVEEAFDQGKLFISMEAISETVTCAGENGCQGVFPYDGPSSPTYCQHIQSRSSYRQLNNSEFLAGALIMPGNRPGWKKADVKDLSALTTDEEKDKILVEIAKMAPHQSFKENEQTMWAIQMQALMETVHKN